MVVYDGTNYQVVGGAGGVDFSQYYTKAEMDAKFMTIVRPTAQGTMSIYDSTEAEAQPVVAAYNEFKAKGFGIVGVSLDNNLESWKKAIKDLNITWAQMSDLKGWQCEGAALYGVRAIPATVLVDQEGTIVARNLRGDELKAKLAELMK